MTFDWRDISEAPRDGTRVRLYEADEGFGYFDGATWLDDDNYVRFPTHFALIEPPKEQG